MTCGIYRIKNLANGKESIGSTRRVEKRLSQQKSALVHHKYPNAMLQADFDIYGLGMFLFELVEALPPDASEELLFEREKFWTEKAHEGPGCYNPFHPRPRHGVGKRPNCIICGSPHYAKGYCCRHWVAFRKGRPFVRNPYIEGH